MTLFEEMIAAGRGMVALLTGRRDASDYFDLTLRGLLGSFIAFLVASVLNAYFPVVMGTAPADAQPWKALLMVGNLYILQIGFSAIVLNQIKRLDGLVPYIVADNWATFYVTLLTIVLGLAGFGGELALILIGILVIIIEINIARLIVTLRPLQIAMLLIAQLVAVTIGLLVLGMFMPIPEGAGI